MNKPLNATASVNALDRIGDDDLGKGKRLDGEFVRHGNQGDRNADSDALDLSV